LEAWGKAQASGCPVWGLGGKPLEKAIAEIAPALNAGEREKLLFKEAIVYLSAN